jgi:Zn-dependent M28 family amino/carboxypeptidase
MKNLYAFLAVLSVMIIYSCSTKPDPNDGIASLTQKGFEEYVKVIASDEFLGRMPFTEGETKTIAYLEEEAKKLGLEPGNGASFMQEVPLAQITTHADSVMTVQSGKKKITLKGFSDYVLWTPRAIEGEIKLTNEEIVFAGYGVVAPEYKWDDYAGLDVKDKIVLVIVNDPGFGTDTTLFKGNTMTYYGRWTYKFEEAARHGAKGCLIIHDTAGAGYDFTILQNSWNTTKLYLDTREKNDYLCQINGWVTEPVAKQLFELAGIKYDEARASANKAGFKASTMKLNLTTSLTTKVKFEKSHNVIAKITGDTQPEEYIIYSAHWDHFGVGMPDAEGDSIYNGAQDNASGTAGLLELAKAFKSLKTKPARSVVFLWVTAEEQGLLGSSYYANNPVYPIKKTVANINLDGLNTTGKTKDVVIIGVGQSQLEDYLREEVEKSGRYIANDPHPEAGYYFRSDHFNFAKVGIPALDAHSGEDDAEKGIEYGKKASDEYVAKYYHKPSDEYSDAWKLDGVIEDLQLAFRIGKRLSMEKTWPAWKEGSEFKALREK